MRGRKMIVKRMFECPECGMKMPATKKRKIGIGHVKHMWCVKCKKVQGFVQTE